MSGRIMRMGWNRLRHSKQFDSACIIRRNDQDLVGPFAEGQFACTVLSLFQGGRIEGDFSTVNSWQVRFPIGTDVQIDDYIIERGRTLQVIEVPSPISYEIYMITICQRV